MFSLIPNFRFVGEINGTPCDGDIIIDKATNEIKCWLGNCGG